MYNVLEFSSTYINAFFSKYFFPKHVITFKSRGKETVVHLGMINSKQEQCYSRF